MKYFIFSDIHGNIEALEAVLRQIDDFRPEKVICLGDVVGYGPNPNECVQRVKEVTDFTIMGNHDHAVLGLTDIAYFNPYAKIAVLWTRETLTEDNFLILNDYLFQKSVDNLLFVHSTPLHPERWDYIFHPLEGKYYLQHLAEQMCFIGHSHQPVYFEEDHDGQVIFDRQPSFSLPIQEGCKYIINDGSVGQPRDGYPDAAYATYDSDEGLVEVKRLSYDIEETQRKMSEANLPEFLIERLTYGR